MTTRRIREWGLSFLILISLLPLGCASSVQAVGPLSVQAAGPLSVQAAGPLSVQAAGPLEIGMSVRMWGTDPATIGRQFDLMDAMHVTWVRADFDWSAIEGDRGHFNWAYPDQIVKEASARGMKVLAILDYTPSWARPSGTTSHAPPDQASDYATFAEAAARRYTPLGVRNWEIWNEPNTSEYWEPSPDANRYGELFRAAATAIRGVDPNATLLTGGLTRGADTPDGRRVSQIAYLQQLYSNGTAQLADAIAVHPYSFPLLPMQAYQEVGGFNDLPALHDLMSRHGDGDKKIWITEFGAATGTGYGAVAENDQANAIMQARERVQTWNWAGPLIYFEMRDGGTDQGDLQQNFGVVRRDLSPKASGEALMN